MTDHLFIDAPAEVRDTFDALPELPDGISELGGVLWLTSAVLKAGLERGWSRDLMRQYLCTMVAGTLCKGADDDEVIIAELQDALVKARASFATKQ